ncbi:stage II sporulation protein R [Bacillus rubiinfantis]|uniref:stage II sporulation protein R n=1 Tax=Bacillus rubiinfantis TaxID=1499680 RepID=UPI0005A96B35
MKSKLVVWLYLAVLSLATVLHLYIPKTEAAAKESIVIPGEAIRLRILANSDFEEDQAIKRKVRDAVNAKVELWVKDLTSKEKAKEVINSKLPEIQKIAEKTVREQGSDQSVKVEFRKVQFPTKLYGQFLYPAGKYQAILITLGSGEGANWWCVLYPPLCFLDFSNGVAVSSEGFEDKESHSEIETAGAAEPDNEADASLRSEETKDSAQTARPEQKQDDQASVEEQNPNDQASEDEQTESVSPIQKPVEEKATPVNGAIESDTPQEKAAVSGDAKPEKQEEIKDSESEKVKQQKKSPVYTKEDEQPVKVKFFAAELWGKLFN